MTSGKIPISLKFSFLHCQNWQVWGQKPAFQTPRTAGKHQSSYQMGSEHSASIWRHCLVIFISTVLKSYENRVEVERSEKIYDFLISGFRIASFINLLTICERQGIVLSLPNIHEVKIEEPNILVITAALFVKSANEIWKSLIEIAVILYQNVRNVALDSNCLFRAIKRHKSHSFYTISVKLSNSVHRSMSNV